MRDTPSARRFRRPVVVALLALAMLLGLTTVTTSEHSAQAATVRYDGDTLIRGLLFGQGPAAQKHPKLVLGAITEPDHNAELLPRLIAQAERAEPGFRAKFAADMYSRDRVRIQRSVLHAGDTFYAAVLVLYPDLADDLAAAGGTQGIATLGPVFNVIALAFQAAAVAQAVAVVEFYLFWLKDPSSSADNQLRLDRWADLVATTLTGN